MIKLRTSDIQGQLIVLGTGTSVGVPMVGCGCETCLSANPKNQRTRCSIVLGLPNGNLLVDTTPDLRTQLLREKIGLVHSVLFTHEHVDHLYGLDDLRLFPIYLGHALPVYCEALVENRIRRAFDYAFDVAIVGHGAGMPNLQIHQISTEPLTILGERIIPIRLQHGRFDVLGFRFGNIAYCTDTNRIPEASWPLLEGLEVLIIDALRPKAHVSHFSLDEAVAVAERLRPRKTYFTHMSHELEHEATNQILPTGMELAYDGLRMPLR